MCVVENRYKCGVNPEKVVMAKLVSVYEEEDEIQLGRRQLPLSVYDKKIVSNCVTGLIKSFCMTWGS